jgi:hypothetical protein
VKRVLALAVLAAALVGGAALVLVTWDGGPLDEAGNGFAGPVQAGQPFTAFYELRNNGDREIEVRGVSLADHTTGLRLLGAQAQTSGSSYGGNWPGFPPRNVKAVPAEGFVLGARADAPLLVGLQADQVGGYVVRGVNVEYRVRYVDHYGPRYQRTLTTGMSLCAQRRPVKARTPLCGAPEIPVPE